MALASVLLSLAAAACTVMGVFAVVMPMLGSVLSLSAPVLAVGGVVCGGVAISRAKRAGQGGSGLALTGVILSTLAFIPALLGALTCGVCSALLTAADPAGALRPNVQFNVRQGGGLVDGDAGVPPWPQPPAARNAADGGVVADPLDNPLDNPTAAPGALPPPPLDPGPGGP